nr:SPOR domain-containing protein [Bordetella pertussis]
MAARRRHGPGRLGHRAAARCRAQRGRRRRAAPRDPARLERADAAAPGRGAGSGVYLQLGAFSQPANAESLVSRINGQLDPASGIPPAVVEQANNLYRVRIGPYATREAALGAVQPVADRTGILPSLSATP